MRLYYGTPEDIDKWMELVASVRSSFPGLETQAALDEHRAVVAEFMAERQAICVKADNEIAGVMLFSRRHNMICCLAVSPKYRRRGVASMLMNEALDNLDRNKAISVTTFRADDIKGGAPRALYEKYGFIEGELVYEMNYPNQKYVLYPDGSEQKARQTAVNRMTSKISSMLSECEPSIYLYGSSVMDDFRLGWSDIDILVLTKTQISEQIAESLVGLRQTMNVLEPNNQYYRLFEGGMLTLRSFLTGEPDRVVYWGTSGERVTDKYNFDSLCLAELLEYGQLLHGEDIRGELKPPSFDLLYDDIYRHYEAIREYAQKPSRSIYSFGWMLDIARCIYTLRTKKMISKSEAGAWALENKLCKKPEALIFALMVRSDPTMYKNIPQTLNYAQTLTEPIQRFADVLERELKLAKSKRTR